MEILNGIAQNVRHSFNTKSQDSNGNSQSPVKTKNIVTFRMDGEVACSFESYNTVKIEEGDKLVAVGKMKRNELKIWGYNNGNVNYIDYLSFGHYLMIGILCFFLIGLLITSMNNLIELFTNSELLRKNITDKHILIGQAAVFLLCVIIAMISFFSVRIYFKHSKNKKRLRRFF